MMRGSRGSSAGAVLAAALLCATPFAAAAQDSTDTFTVRFSWKIGGEYAPLYYAQENGLFERCGA